MDTHIAFTQFLRPHGRTKTVFYELSDAKLYQKALAVIELGSHFEIEELTTRHVSLEVVSRQDPDESWANEVCENGPEVHGAVRRLIEAAFTNSMGRGTASCGPKCAR